MTCRGHSKRQALTQEEGKVVSPFIIDDSLNTGLARHTVIANYLRAMPIGDGSGNLPEWAADAQVRVALVSEARFLRCGGSEGQIALATLMCRSEGADKVYLPECAALINKDAPVVGAAVGELSTAGAPEAAWALTVFEACVAALLMAKALDHASPAKLAEINPNFVEESLKAFGRNGLDTAIEQKAFAWLFSSGLFADASPLID